MRNQEYSAGESRVVAMGEKVDKAPGSWQPFYFHTLDTGNISHQSFFIQKHLFLPLRMQGTLNSILNTSFSINLL